MFACCELTPYWPPWTIYMLISWKYWLSCSWIANGGGQNNICVYAHVYVPQGYLAKQGFPWQYCKIDCNKYQPCLDSKSVLLGENQIALSIGKPPFQPDSPSFLGQLFMDRRNWLVAIDYPQVSRILVPQNPQGLSWHPFEQAPKATTRTETNKRKRAAVVYVGLSINGVPPKHGSFM